MPRLRISESEPHAARTPRREIYPQFSVELLILLAMCARDPGALRWAKTSDDARRMPDRFCIPLNVCFNQ